jgi:succinyl-CoA synthetase alpha subunit
MTKPVVAFVAGRTAPPGKRMGHAGAIIAGGSGTAAEKVAAFEKAKIKVAESPAEVATLLKEELEKLKVKAKRKPKKKTPAKKVKEKKVKPFTKKTKKRTR